MCEAHKRTHTVGHPSSVCAQGLCLCVQHPRNATDADPTINMTVFVTHTHMRAQISIPLVSFDRAQVNRVRVVCCRMADMLMLYVPGEYLAMIDCGAADDPRASLVCTGTFLCAVVVSW